MKFCYHWLKFLNNRASYRLYISAQRFLISFFEIGLAAKWTIMQLCRTILGHVIFYTYNLDSLIDKIYFFFCSQLLYLNVQNCLMKHVHIFHFLSFPTNEYLKTSWKARVHLSYRVDTRATEVLSEHPSYFGHIRLQALFVAEGHEINVGPRNGNISALVSLCEGNPSVTGALSSRSGTNMELCCFLHNSFEESVAWIIDLPWFETSWSSFGVIMMMRGKIRQSLMPHQ